MSNSMYFVFTLPPAEVTDEQFSAWYDTHVAEVLEVPGFLAARRYWLAQGVPNRAPIVFGHLGAYVLDGASTNPVAELGRRLGAGEMTTEPWFGDVRVEAFTGRALEDPEIELTDHAYMVLSHAPRRFTTEEYYGWYYAHSRENLTSDGFETAWRYALAHDVPDPESPSRAATHGAFYKVHGELPTLREALKRSFEAGRVDIPDWMSEGEFVSYDCHAAAALNRAPAVASSAH